MAILSKSFAFNKQCRANASKPLWNEISVITSETKTQTRAICKQTMLSTESSTCLHCGGNGYMKSSPNCYHTCLNCLGRGLKSVLETN